MIFNTLDSERTLETQFRILLDALSNSSPTVADYTVDLVYAFYEPSRNILSTNFVDDWKAADASLSERLATTKVTFRLSSREVLGLEQEGKAVKENLPRLNSKGILYVEVLVSRALSLNLT